MTDIAQAPVLELPFFLQRLSLAELVKLGQAATKRRDEAPRLADWLVEASGAEYVRQRRNEKAEIPQEARPLSLDLLDWNTVEVGEALGLLARWCFANVKQVETGELLNLLLLTLITESKHRLVHCQEIVNAALHSAQPWYQG